MDAFENPHRLEPVELTPEQAERWTRQSQASALRGRIFLQKADEARRAKIDLVRGIVRKIGTSGRRRKAILEMEGRRVELTITEGAIAISAGDVVLLAGGIRDPLYCSIYYNETKGSSSLESAYKGSRLLIALGCLASLAAFALAFTVALAVGREPAFLSRSGAIDALAYTISAIGSAGFALVSVLFLRVGIKTRRMCALVQSVVLAK
ncbi:MAG TPA: hypothetical protein VFW83_07950 [Bryobacteraceae bacterium]|nr:hypothetical protein [Bryobacteraceae bacterium]